MLKCRDLAHIASDYIDGELGPMDTVSVKMHLMMCGHCRNFIGNLRSSIKLMEAHSSTELDEELLRRIDEQITKALGTKSRPEDKSE